MDAFTSASALTRLTVSSWARVFYQFSVLQSLLASFTRTRAYPPKDELMEKKREREKERVSRVDWGSVEERRVRAIIARIRHQTWEYNILHSSCRESRYVTLRYVGKERKSGLNGDTDRSVR